LFKPLRIFPGTISGEGETIMNGGNTTIRPWAQGTAEWVCKRNLDEFHPRWRVWVQARMKMAGDLDRASMTGLWGAAMQLCAVTNWPVGDVRPKPSLSRLMDFLGRGIDETRMRFSALRLSANASASCEPSPLEQELSVFAQKLTPEEASKLRILVMGRAKKADCDAKSQVFPIMQETLLNALRRSKATSVEAEIEYLPYRWRIVVRDNGVGVRADSRWWERDSHAALAVLSERAQTIGAQFRAWSSPKAGTEVEISLPV
jgi:hypothetical protein